MIDRAVSLATTVLVGLLGLSLAALASVSMPIPAAAEPRASTTNLAAMAGCEVARINAVRASNGLDPLLVDDDLSQFAQSWSDHMAAASSLAHNPDLVHAPGTWSLAGENVGVGPDVNLVFDGFVASPHHYVNLVDPDFTVVGIGVSTNAKGLIYTTQDFEVRSPAAEPPPNAIAPAACATTLSTRIDLSLHQTRGLEPL